MKNPAKVFLHILILSGDICREGCKVVKMTAVSRDGKRFCYQPDGSNYYSDGQKMWNDFKNFCHSCGIGKGCGEVWLVSSTAEVGTTCQPCRFANCVNIFDDLDYLGDWETKYLEWEYNHFNFMQRPQLGFQDFCKTCGLGVLSDAQDVQKVYEKYTTLIEKDSFSEEECEQLVDYVRSNAVGIFGAGNVRRACGRKNNARCKEENCDRP